MLEQLRSIPNSREPSRAFAPLVLAEAQWAAFIGDFEGAADQIEDVKTLMDTEGDPYLRLQVKHLEADIADLSGQDEAALERFGDAISEALLARLPFDESLLRFKMGRVLERLGRVADARSEFEQALAIAQPLGLSGPIVDGPAEALQRLDDA